MRTDIENFISEIVLAEHLNPNTDGNVEAPTGFFGYMHISPEEFTIDGMDTPYELLGKTVVAIQDNYGNILYHIHGDDTRHIAHEWFTSQTLLFAEYHS